MRHARLQGGYFRSSGQLQSARGRLTWSGAHTGDIVIKFQCDGCMASDHQFQWVGEIIRFADGNGTMAGYHFATVKIIKRGNQDIRDQDLGTERVVLDEGSFQRLSANLFGYYK